MPTATDARIHVWNEVEEDQPIPQLRRRRVIGAQMLVAHVRLEKGCLVATHSHVSEQMAYVISGKVRLMLGDPASSNYREEIIEGGTLVEFPSNFPHGVEALEDTFIVDILSPPGAMGVDSHTK